MKVLFIDGIDSKGGMVNLGLGFLAQYIRRKHEVKILSIAYNTIDEIVSSVDKFEVIGFSCITSQFNNCINLAKLIKNRFPEKQIVFGGIHATAVPHEVMEHGFVSYVCVGEAEISFSALLDFIEGKLSKLEEVPGIVYRGRDGCLKFNNIKFMDDIDIIGMPAWDLLEREKSSGKRNVITSRGCPFTCSYCYNSTMRSKFKFKYRRRGVASVIDECVFLKNEGAQYIAFSDDLFLIDEKWLFEFAELYGRHVRIPFGIAARPEAVLRQESSLKMLKESGLRDVWIGVESGSERVRREILNRKMKNIDIISAFRMIRELGLQSKSYNIVGLPTESLLEALETFWINIKANPNFTSHYTLMPYPETKVWHIAKSMGLFNESENCFDDSGNIQFSETLISRGCLHTGKMNATMILALRHLWRSVFGNYAKWRVDYRVVHFCKFLFFSFHSALCRK